MKQLATSPFRFPTYACALFLFGLCGTALLPIYGKVMRRGRRHGEIIYRKSDTTGRFFS